MLRHFLFVTIFIALQAQSSEASELAVSDWNQAVLAAAEAEDGFLTLKGLRTTTLMHLAMHDALNSAAPRYATFLRHDVVPEANASAAAQEAAWQIARQAYPDNEALQDIYRKAEERFPAGAERTSSLRLGRAVAAAILEHRGGDGWDAEAEYRWHPMAPGVYAEFHEHSGTPEGFIFGSGWGTAKGFALEAPMQFKAPPPPAIESEDYARAFEEVKSVGRFQSMSRTPEQTHIALWWKDFAENSHNRLVRDLAAGRELDDHTLVRLFALVNMSIYDAYVASFANKFHYNHWRPFTAIRWAANDSNPLTVADETWDNTHRHTYAFPSYPSAHGTACGAAMTAIASVLGDDMSFAMRTPAVDIAGPFSGKLAMDPPERHFDRFSDAAMECAMSRVYLGIHFRYDSIEGYRLGGKVGENVVDSLLRPLDESNAN